MIFAIIQSNVMLFIAGGTLLAAGVTGLSIINIKKKNTNSKNRSNRK